MPNDFLNMASRVLFPLGLAARQAMSAAALVLLCRNFMDCNSTAGKRRLRRSAWIGCVYFLVYAGIYCTLPGAGNWGANIPALLASLFVCLWMEQKNIRTKIFLFCTFGIIHWISLAIANSVSHFVALFLDTIIVNTAGQENPSLQAYYFFLSFLPYFLLHTLSYGVLIFCTVRKINQIFVSHQHDMEAGELALLLLPSVNGIVFYGLFRIYADIEDEIKISLFESHVALELLWLLCYVVILAVILGTISLYQNIRKKQEEERAGILLESQVKDIQSHIAEVEKLYAGIRGIKHDIRNHIEVINSLLAQNKTDEVRAYAASLSETVETFDFAVKTGNPVTDVIIHEKMGEAAERGITFCSDFHYPADMGINAFDASVILSNALTNAIEAGREGGFIHISSFRNKNAYLITVENSFAGSLDFDGESGLPKTSKGDKKAHGFGLQNMKSVAAKYYGDVQIAQTGDKVTVTVMLLSAG